MSLFTSAHETNMPLTHKGNSILHALENEYGDKKGEQILYAGKNKGTFTGIDLHPDAPPVVQGNAALMDSKSKENTFQSLTTNSKNAQGGNSGAVISHSPGLGASAYQDSSLLYRQGNKHGN